MIRKRLLRGATACALAVGLVIPIGAQPAQATGVDTVINLADFVVKFLNFSSDGSLSAEELVALVKILTDAVHEAENTVVNHVDAVAAAANIADAHHNIIEVYDIDNMLPITRQQWAISVTGDSTKAAAYLNAVNDTRSADDIGYAIMALFPIAVLARAKSGLKTEKTLDAFKTAAQALVNKLSPSCSAWQEPDPPLGQSYYYYTCTAYDGTQSTYSDLYYSGEHHYEIDGAPQSGPVPQTTVQDMATRNTSRRAAQEYLHSIGL